MSDIEQEFAYMDPAVDELCHSLVHDPDRWLITTYTLDDTKTGMEYWLGSGSKGHIYCTWNGRSSNRVFSDAQANRIAKAYQIMRQHKESVAQRKVMEAMGAVPKRDPMGAAGEDLVKLGQPAKKRTGFWAWLFGFDK